MGILPDPPRRGSSRHAAQPAAALPEFPTRPDDVPAELTVVELLEAYELHLYAVARGRAGEPVAAGLLARHAVAALALAQAIVDAFLEERWPLVRDGLAGGTPAGDVGVALGGLEVTEVAAGLTSWAGRARGAGVLSLTEYDAVLALITTTGGCLVSGDVPGVPAMPAGPFDVDECAALPAVLAAAERHEWAVIAAGCGIESRTTREVADHALAALALGEAVRIRVALERGATIRDALAAGASLAEVAHALDTGPAYVVDDLEGWADAQVRAGAMDAAERDRVRALVARAGGAR